MTTGDVITPREIEYTFSLLFDDRTISILAYNLETVLAEKIETVLSRSIANTRPRDFYDIHILYALRGAECNAKTLLQALEQTADKRGSRKVLEIYPDIIAKIRASEQLRGFWKKYQRDFIFPLMMPAILSSALWTVSRSKQKVRSGYGRNSVWYLYRVKHCAYRNRHIYRQHHIL